MAGSGSLLAARAELSGRASLSESFASSDLTERAALFGCAGSPWYSGSICNPSPVCVLGVGRRVADRLPDGSSLGDKAAELLYSAGSRDQVVIKVLLNLSDV